MPTDPRFLAGSGRDVYNGNELLVKGCLEVEGGVHLYTGYPGSPVAAFFDILGSVGSLLNDKGIKAFQANNEALSIAAMNGSQMAPIRCVAAFKSVGLHVASDALALGNLAGAHPAGGAVIICGDDPWCDSTQVPADSRFLCEHLRMPVIEPGDIQQLKDWIDAGFKLSSRAELYTGFIVTTLIADGGGTVDLKPNHYPAVNTKAKLDLVTSQIDLGKVLLPPKTITKELDVGGRHALAIDIARELGLNAIVETGGATRATPAPIGFIVTGVAESYLRQVLADVGLAGQFPILRMGMPYPCDVQLAREFSHLAEKVVVIEERRSFVERLIRDGLFKVLPGTHEAMPIAEAAAISGKLFGKAFPDGLAGIPETRGLNPSVLAQLIIPLLKSTETIAPELRNGRLSSEMDLIRATGKRKLVVMNAAAATISAAANSEKLIARTPTFCPGCPHRDSSSLLLEVRELLNDAAYMKRVHKRGPIDLVAHGDTGCYTMLMYAPTEQLMHNYSGMGLGGGTGSGIDPFITNKQIVFMGDGTFFHSGAVAISHAIKSGQDITFIILANGTTAMTGHQEHPGTERDVLGNESDMQSIGPIVRGMKGTSKLTVTNADPADRTTWKKSLEKAILSDGVKVLIAEKECGITYHRRRAKAEREVEKKKGYLPYKQHMNITPEVCEGCLECTKATACPGLITADTDYGRKIDTDLTWCVNDGACERVRTSNEAGTTVKPCPSFEQIIVKRRKRTRYRLPNMGLGKLPEPTRKHDLADGDAWRVHLSGVGGMGIGVVSSILVRAGHNEGYRVVFADKKGLAIRNGGVYAQITWLKSAAPGPAMSSGLIPYGKADVLLGIDVLEAARAIDPREQFRVASPGKTSAVLNVFKQPTVSTLLGRADFDPMKLRDEIFEHCDAASSFAQNLSDLCEQRLGSKQFVNIMMLGVAFQLGLMPLSNGAIASAIRQTIRRDQRKNIKAFNIGRKIVLNPNVLPAKPEPRTWDQLLTAKLRILRRSRWRGGKLGSALESMVQASMAAMLGLSAESKYDATLRAYDLLQYDKPALAEDYLRRIKAIYDRDIAAHQYAATAAAIRGLAKVMLIKDEPYVAYLLTRPEKHQRDIEKYRVDTANGDTIKYRHHTSPEFPMPGGRRLRLSITTTDWQLKLVATFGKVLRKLPGWHRRETDFRDWYASLLNRVSLSTPLAYEQALRVLGSVTDVTGYREVRYPKMTAAQKQVEADLAATPAVEVTVQRDVLRRLQPLETAGV